MYVNLSHLISLPERDALYATLPLAFKSHYPRLTAILDCFKVFIDQPKNLKSHALVYSTYKKHSTVKVCTPCGAVSFVSSVSSHNDGHHNGSPEAHGIWLFACH